MSNPFGRMSAPMIQPTKQELREIIDEQREELKQEQQRCRDLQKELDIMRRKLDAAANLLGNQLIEAKFQHEISTATTQPRLLRRI